MMMAHGRKCRIKIVPNGPYIVTGNVPLLEKIIVTKDKVTELENGNELPQSENYALCRCGQSETAPFCDGSHGKVGFKGAEQASRDTFEDRAKLVEGPNLDLLDDQRCAYVRLCHKKDGMAWRLTKNSNNPTLREEAIISASECPAGRIVAYNKAGKAIETEYEPSIEIIQDPEQQASGPISVKGNIPIESSDGYTYEIRNRVTLCRCGKSKNKPFCDASHIETRRLKAAGFNV